MYRIKDWALHFENAESRKIKGARWLPLPNKHDGKGFRRMARHPRKVEVFCAWTLILQVASKCPVRGELADENGPLTALDLEDITDFPEEIFTLAFEVLKQDRIGWIDEIPWPGPVHQEKPGESPDAPGDSAGSSRQTPNESGTPGNEGIEGREGIERKKEKIPPFPPATPFDQAVTDILAAYPKSRERDGGRKEAVHVGEGDRGRIADFINADPTYPLLAAVKQYDKATKRPKNLREWLQNPTAREIVLKALEAEKGRDSPPASPTPAAGPVGPSEEEQRKISAIANGRISEPETRRLQNVGT